MKCVFNKKYCKGSKARDSSCLCYSNDGSRLLPRPISICGIEGDTLRIVYRAVGKGTQEFATMHAGQTLEVQGPLGNGYDISKVSKERKSDLVWRRYRDSTDVGAGKAVRVVKRALYWVTVMNCF
mgnify:CR=1 FL=1